MRSPALQAFFVAVIGTLLACATPDVAAAAVSYGACPRLGSFQCTSVDVPLDRSGRLPGTIALAVARKPSAADDRPTADAVVALAGGPGQSAISLAPDFAQLLQPALAGRDLLVFDQRGTGSSQPLHCSTRGSTPSARGRSCARSIGPSRGLYTTDTSVEDLEALRVATGYDKLVLYGVSYGTRLALDYAARHPDHVASLVLDSVVLPDGGDPLMRPSFAAMPRVLSDLCARGACDAITRRPTRDLAGEVQRLAHADLHGELTSAGGRLQPSLVTRQDLLNIVLSGDLNPTLRAELPGSIVAARRGDSAPLIRLAARAADLVGLAEQARPQDFDEATFIATSCEETNFPWTRAAGATQRGRQLSRYVRRLGRRPFGPFDSATAAAASILGLCRGWPNAAPPPVPAGPLPNVPTLVLSGAADLRTPLEDAQRVRTLIPAAQVLSVPFTGHSVMSSERSAEHCSARALGQFVAGQPIAVCSETVNPYPPSPVPARRIATLPGTGSADAVGRTITAVLRTIGDERRQVVGDLLEIGRLPARAGGLRGGYVAVDSATESLHLHGVEFVPGVSVSGVVPLRQGRGVARVTVRGRAATSGTLEISGAQISGRLGGRTINLASRVAAANAGPPSLSRLRRGIRLRRAG